MARAQKTKIKTCFNKAWKTYDGNCSVQKTVCEKAIEMLKQYRHQYANVVDVACGTGVSTQCLAGQIECHTLYAIDFSERLLAVAKEKNLRYPVEWIGADFDDNIFEPGSQDLVFCNMGLQWSLNLKKTLALFYEYLHNAGVCAFTMPLSGTFPEIQESHKNIFHSKEAVSVFLKACGFNELYFQEEYFQERFSSQMHAIDSIKHIGANCLMSNKNRGLRTSRTTGIFVNNSIRSLSYMIGIFIAVKK